MNLAGIGKNMFLSRLNRKTQNWLQEIISGFSVDLTCLIDGYQSEAQKWHCWSWKMRERERDDGCGWIQLEHFSFLCGCHLKRLSSNQMSRGGCLADHDSIGEQILDVLKKEGVFDEIQFVVASWREERCCCLWFSAERLHLKQRGGRRLWRRIFLSSGSSLKILLLFNE